jgi:hypothetical protein
MNEREAQEIVRMIEGNWQMDLGTARGMFRDELMQYEVELAIKAVHHLAKRVTYKIRLADLSQTLLMLSRNAKADQRTEQDRRAIEQGKRGYATPEWVWVWKWARNYRDPQDWRTFPQQDGIPEFSMATSDYEALREEWVAAGSPKERGRILVKSI